MSSYDSDNPDAPFREISASDKEMGAKTKTSYVPIEHETKKNEWTTVFVEWSDHEGSFHVNGKEIHGVFTCKDHALFDVGGISIGGKDDSSHSLKGAISSLEIYVVGKTHGDGGVPDSLMNLIISRQMISHGNDLLELYILKQIDSSLFIESCLKL